MGCVMNSARYLFSTLAAISRICPVVTARTQLALRQIMSFRTKRRRIGVIVSLGCMAWLSGLVLAQSSEPMVHPVGGAAPQPVAMGRAKLIAHVTPDQKLRLVLGLQPPHPAEEEQFVHDLQDRNSPDFHHFLTAEEWNTKFAPSAGDEQAVVNWAESAGLTVTHHFLNRLVVDLEAPVATIEKAFNVTINRYALGTRTFFANDRDPSIPGELGSIIHSVGGLSDYEQFKAANNFGLKQQFPMYSSGPVKSAGPSGGVSGDRSKLPVAAMQAGRGEPALLPSTSGAYDPTDLYSSYAYDTNALYHLGHCCNPLGNAGVTPPETSIAVATVGINDPNDFVGFHNQYPYLAYHYQIYFVDGTPTTTDGEGTLDFEWATAMSNSFGAEADTSMVYLYEGANNASSTWTDIFNQILSDGNARVFTNSHYCSEVGCNDQGTMDTQHSIFNAMLGQGWTLIAISGDGGATADCATTVVGWPGNDPDMLTVGGTTLDLSFAGIRPIHETGWTGGTSAGSCRSNDGGGGGGCSTKFAAPGYQQANPACGVNSRSVPDVALNSNWVNTPQNAFVGGKLVPTGGTSIAAPEMAGFFAQENAYLLYIGAGIGNNCHGSSPCAPLGQPNPAIYYEGFNAPYAAHYPFYDTQDGCNSNDVTAAGGLTFYCAGAGYDLVTGWGSVNMLHLAWLFNTWAAADFGPPSIKFSGPLVNHWYNADQGVFWLATDTSGNGAPPIGVAGFTGLWDTDPGNIYSDPIPGCCDSYYQGPQVTTTNLGSTFVSAAGQGCHTVHVRAWDDTGLESADSIYGPVCYDTIAPVTTASLAGVKSGTIYVSSVKDTLSATDFSPGSGVASTVYQINSGAVTTYTGPFTISANGNYTVSFHSTDIATNVESTHTMSLTIARWLPETSGTGFVLREISCVSSSKCEVVGGGGVIRGTTNGGSTWTAQASGTTNQLNAISCQGAFCVAVGNGGTIGVTTNSGGTWNTKPSGTTQNLNGISCASSSFCVAAGNGGTILATTNGGNSWSKKTSGTANNLTGVSCSTTSNCKAVGAGGTIRGTTNGGGTWTGQTSGTTNGLLGVYCRTGTNFCAAVGSGGTILVTTNGGTNWSKKSSGTSNGLNGVSCSSTSVCRAVGNNGTVLSTTNGGGSWSAQPSGITKALFGVNTQSITLAYAVGASGTILKQ